MERKPGRPHARKRTDQERVDEAIAESFPASDPPSWTGGLEPDEDGEER